MQYKDKHSEPGTLAWATGPVGQQLYLRIGELRWNGQRFVPVGPVKAVCPVTEDGELDRPAETLRQLDVNDPSWSTPLGGSVYRYLYLSRPPALGTQPAGYAERQEWSYQAHGTWGYVTYPEPLSWEQVEAYDLLPVNPLRRALHVLDDAGIQVVHQYAEVYRTQPRIFDRYRTGRDTTAWAVGFVLDLGMDILMGEED